MRKDGISNNSFKRVENRFHNISERVFLFFSDLFFPVIFFTILFLHFLGLLCMELLLSQEQIGCCEEKHSLYPLHLFYFLAFQKRDKIRRIIHMPFNNKRIDNQFVSISTVACNFNPSLIFPISPIRTV